MTRNNKIKSIVAAVGLGLALIVPAAFAIEGQNGGGQRGEGHEWHKRGGGHGEFAGGWFMSELGLSDAQKAQGKQIWESHQESLKALRQQIRAKEQELRQAEQGDTFNEAAVTQKLTEIAPLRARLMAEMFQVRQQMLAILTPDQKAKLDQMRADAKARHAAHQAQHQAPQS